MTSSRLRILENGALEIVDPRFEDLTLLREVDPGFTVLTAPLSGFSKPHFQTMRKLGCGFSTPELRQMDVDQLWLAHVKALLEWKSGAGHGSSKGEACVLDLKLELAGRILRRCTLCARRCGVDRLAGSLGFCGLGPEAIVAESFIHIGEEPPINPSYVLSLAGCALRCRFCQQSAILHPKRVNGTTLGPASWKELDLEGARSLSFVGGNPDESLFAILQFLNSASSEFKVPIVWNSHAYSSPEAVDLLNGIVDVYLPDLKYSNPACALRWSKVEDYPEVARQTIMRMVDQHVLVMVRILLLPGHLHCCHLPALHFLASLPIPPKVSIRGQYSPDWKITASDGEMATRLTKEEVESATGIARSLGLALVASDRTSLNPA